MKRLLPLLLAACGATASGSGTTPPPTAAPQAAEPAPLHCPPLVRKIHTCADAFEIAYAKTTDAGHRGRQTPGGADDGAAGAKALMVAFRLPHNRDSIGLDMCARNWAIRDPRWTERLQACDLTASCEAFSACAAPAIGEPLPPPK